MKRIPSYINTVVVLAMLTIVATKTAITQRLEDIDNDRGDVPGWAIASGAACVLAAIVYAAYSGVIKKWVAKIN